MQSFFAVKNSTKFPVISVFIDGERVFYDILKGDTSPFATVNAGSIAFSVYNNFERQIFDIWLSVPPDKQLTVVVTESGITFS